MKCYKGNKVDEWQTQPSAQVKKLRITPKHHPDLAQQAYMYIYREIYVYIYTHAYTTTETEGKLQLLNSHRNHPVDHGNALQPRTQNATPPATTTTTPRTAAKHIQKLIKEARTS